MVQVDAFRGHVRAEQEPHRPACVSEFLDDALLVDVAHAAVEDLDLVRLES